MLRKIDRPKTLALLLLAVLWALPAWAQDHSRHQGRMGQGMGQGGNQRRDMQTIHALFNDHRKITRTVKQLENGVETVTESDDPKVRGLIAEHVWAMQQRLEQQQPIRMWDPLFAELFKHAAKIKMQISKTPKGMKVVETANDPYVVKLIQAHAAGVSEFVSAGSAVMHKRHELPGEKTTEPAFIGKGDGLETCPVTGEPVNREIKFGFWGRTVYFCCESCRETAKQNPARYIKP